MFRKCFGFCYDVFRFSLLMCAFDVLCSCLVTVNATELVCHEAVEFRLKFKTSVVGSVAMYLSSS